MGPALVGLDNGLQTWRGSTYEPAVLRDKILKDFAKRDCIKSGLFDLVQSTKAGHVGRPRTRTHQSSSWLTLFPLISSRLMKIKASNIN